MSPALKRFLLSLFVAGLTFWMSLETVYLTHQANLVRGFNTQAGHTRGYILHRAANHIEAFRKEIGHLPQTLQEVEEVLSFSKYERESWATDSWKNQLSYRREGKGFVLLSYGHDGKPGGLGLDADIVYGDKKLSNIPTFWQFLTYSEAGFLHPACLAAAFFTFFVAMYAGDKDAREGKKAGSVETLFSIALMVGVSVLGAVFMGGLEYPNGH